MPGKRGKREGGGGGGGRWLWWCILILVINICGRKDGGKVEKFVICVLIYYSYYIATYITTYTLQHT